MIVDTSAIVAILGAECDARLFAEAIAEALERRVSAATYVEAGIVLDSRRDVALSRSLDDFIRNTRIIVEPVTAEQAELAREAYRDFGKGRHQAGLNFGDCFAYALAKDKGEPLLFKGHDFRKTDVEVAEY
ncbi:MAG TPA: type II toxin-antitoxin system VapC family toxin [Terriglobales bacterium]|nr:type II toxin-antitoxin system VapC family toxin [Terriglobales bacterium]